MLLRSRLVGPVIVCPVPILVVSDAAGMPVGKEVGAEKCEESNGDA